LPKNKTILKLAPYLEKGRLEAGCDEAGRGCLAGPVVAAAVILPEDYFHPLLNDSKKINEKQRNLLRIEIEQNALAYGIGIVDHQKIDKINILNASFLAMHRAVDQLDQTPDHLLIDGNRFNPYPQINHTCIIKGDGKYLAIAAASILAKTMRDEIMEELHLAYPQYDWKSNKGYPTQKHREGILKHGECPYHRKSFTLLKPEQLSLF